MVAQSSLKQVYIELKITYVLKSLIISILLWSLSNRFDIFQNFHLDRLDVKYVSVSLYTHVYTYMCTCPSFQTRSIQKDMDENEEKHSSAFKD